MKVKESWVAKGWVVFTQLPERALNPSVLVFEKMVGVCVCAF